MNVLSKNIRLFWEGAVLSYKALFRWFHPMTYLASKVLAPLASMIFFTLIGTFGGSAPKEFFVIGNAMQIAAISGIYGVTMSISGDRWDGTLPYLFGCPSNRLVIFFGRSFIHIFDGMIGVFIGFFWGALLFGVRYPISAMPILTLCVVLTVFSTSGMGLLMGCIGLISRNVMFVNNTIYFLLLLFAGSNVPIADLPPWMQAISNCVPLRHGIEASRMIIGQNGSIHEIQILLLKETGIGLIYLTLGYMLFRWFETQAKKRGTLEAV